MDYKKTNATNTTVTRDLEEVTNTTGNIYFGELTFFHFSGLVPFNPIEWDYKFGEWIKLPNFAR